MQTNYLLRKLIILALVSIFAFTLAGCAISPYSGEKEASKAGIGAGVGAAGGAILGGVIGGGRGALIGAAAGGLTGAAIGHSMDRESAELRQRLVGTGVQVVRQKDGIQLSMSSDVTFKIDSADINSSFYPTLDSVAIVLKKYNRTNVIVSGFTDSIGSAAHNQVLSEKRAESVGNYLISRGVAATRVFTQGYGKRYPVESNATAYGRAKNRRVIITLRPLA